MRQTHKIAMLTLCCLMLICLSLFAADKRLVIDDISVDSTALLVDFHAENLIDDDLRDRLRSGFTTIFEYEIQLWKKRTFVFNQQIGEKIYRIKLSFDNWERRYRIISEDEIRKTASIQKVREMCLEAQKFSVFPLNKIKRNVKYAATVRLVLKPISVANLEEIEKALAGKKRQSEKSQDKNNNREPVVRNRFLKFLLAFTGFSDKVLNSKDVSFHLDSQNKIVWDD